MSGVPERSLPGAAPPTARRWWQGAAAVWVALLGFAFFAAPHSCAWGLEAYTWTGIALLLVALLAPLWTDAPRRGRHALGLAAVTLAVWCGGVVLADFQLLCRLF